MFGPDEPGGLESELLRQQIHLYLYGELSLAEREQVERFLEQDSEFKALFEEEKAFLLALEVEDIAADVESMLPDCREDLAIAVAGEARAGGSPGAAGRIRRRLRDFGAALWARPLAWQPVAAALLLGIGFALGGGLGSGPTPASLGQRDLPVSFDQDSTLTGIETVRLDPVGGEVQIVLEERRVVTGVSSDPAIRSILLETVEGSHAGARLSSLEALQSHAADAEVRRALLRSMLEDENPGVRLKAMDAVRSQLGHSDVREALLQTLRADPVEGMRVHAIQMLSERPSRDIAGALQELVEQEPNPFVLYESERILDSLDASMERF